MLGKWRILGILLIGLVLGTIWLYPDKTHSSISTYVEQIESRLGLSESSSQLRDSIRSEVSPIFRSIEDRVRELASKFENGSTSDEQSVMATPEIDAPSGVERDREYMIEIALDLINEDRVAHGQNRVELGRNSAAQQHADDMLQGTYISHWDREGLKPYMIYSLLEGQGYVSENVAVDGWSTWDWRENDCHTFLVKCQLPDAEDSIRDLHWRMVNDDAASDWGHRENILDSNHELVNIGVAWNSRFVVLVQHFEKISLTIVDQPTISNGQLSVSFELQESVASIGDLVTVYFDPLPLHRIPRMLTESGPGSYCYGGGYTPDCIDELIRILIPPTGNEYYPELDHNEIVASKWSKTGRRYDIGAEVDRFTKVPGIYTLVIWNDDLDSIIFARSLWVN